MISEVHYSTLDDPETSHIKTLDEFKEDLTNLLDSHKALYCDFRNHEDCSKDEFIQVFMDASYKPFLYEGGAAPRTMIPVKQGSNILYTANEVILN